jgi:hypothetical protein
MKTLRLIILVLIFLSLLYPFMVRNNPDNFIDYWLNPISDKERYQAKIERLIAQELEIQKKQTDEVGIFEWLVKMNVQDLKKTDESKVKHRVYETKLQRYIRDNFELVFPLLSNKLKHPNHYERSLAYNCIYKITSKLPEVLLLYRDSLDDYSFIGSKHHLEGTKIAYVSDCVSTFSYERILFLLDYNLGYSSEELWQLFPKHRLYYDPSGSKRAKTEVFSNVNKLKTWFDENREMILERARKAAEKRKKE